MKKGISKSLVLVITLLMGHLCWGQAEIEVSPNPLDLDTLYTNRHYRFEIELTNTGTDTLFVYAVLASNGSDVAERPKQPIPPKSKGSIVLHVRTYSYPQPFVRRTFTIRSNIENYVVRYQYVLVRENEE